MEAVFRSKVDLWLVAVIIGIPVFLIGFFFNDAELNKWRADIVALVIVVGVLAIVAWLYFTTRYTITAQSLFVKAGPFTWVIPLRDITRIEPTRSPASSPALSLDRLVIHYGIGEELMVSPVDKEGFMTELRKQMKSQSDAILR